MSNRRGKTIDRSTEWSKWTWNDRGFWVASRCNDLGQEEYDYRYLETEATPGPNTSSPPPTPAPSTGYSIDNTSSSLNALGLQTTDVYPLRTTEVYPSYPAAYSLSAPLSQRDGNGYDGLVESFSSASIQPNNAHFPVDPGTARYTSGSEDHSYGAGEQEFEIIQTPGRFFKVGRVFKVLWTEPAGDTSDNEDSFVTSSKYGQKAFSKVRHFVVLREMERCSLCLSLNTFNSQGATKPGVRPQNYAAVYPMGGQPQVQAGEGLVKEPFPIIVENPRETIDPMSRLNFSRVYTVEHNLKALKVGRIPDENLPLLTHYFGTHITGQLELGSGSEIREGPQLSSYSSTASGLDPRYKVVETKNQKKFFKVGRVFSILWTEPASFKGGASSSSVSLSSTLSSQFSPTYLGGTAFAEIRRYVIIQEGYGNSLCCPIHTYGGQATLKPNLPDAMQHAIIYTSKNPPDEYWYTAADKTIVSENLSKDPIKVKREQSGREGDLGDRARINYSKIYTIEHYNKVLNIGMVEPHWIDTLVSNSLVRRSDPPEKPRNHPRQDRRKDGRKDKEHDKGGSRKSGKEPERAYSRV